MNVIKYALYNMQLLNLDRNNGEVAGIFKYTPNVENESKLINFVSRFAKEKNRFLISIGHSVRFLFLMEIV